MDRAFQLDHICVNVSCNQIQLRKSSNLILMVYSDCSGERLSNAGTRDLTRYSYKMATVCRFKLECRDIFNDSF